MITTTKAPKRTTTKAPSTTNQIRHVFQSTETLWGLADRYLGSGSRWEEIAALNNISDPTAIPNGTVLLISTTGATRISTTTTPRATTTTKPKGTATASSSYQKPVIEIVCWDDFNTDLAYESYTWTPGWSAQEFTPDFGSIRVAHGDGNISSVWTREQARTEGLFEHTYYSPGQYTVRAQITDGGGQTATDSCTWTWAGPAVFSYNPDSYLPSTSCPSGYYPNLDGWCIPSPTREPYQGWTARCRDGYYSYSLNRSGTCSYHGGVDFFYGDLLTTPTWTVPLDLFNLDLPTFGWEPNYGGTWTPQPGGRLPIIIPSEPFVSAWD